MNEDDELPVPADAKAQGESRGRGGACRPSSGKKLRNLFADVELQPVPDRLSELLEALAAKEKKS